MVIAVSQNGRALRHASEELRSDPEIAMKAVSQYGQALRHASEELRGDHEIVATAVSQDGTALLYASEELKSDHEIVTKAVSESGWALGWASNELRGDVRLIELALTRGEPEECLVFLKVTLLSGRTFNQIFDTAEGHENVEDPLQGWHSSKRHCMCT